MLNGAGAVLMLRDVEQALPTLNMRLSTAAVLPLRFRHFTAPKPLKQHFSPVSISAGH